MTLKEAFEQALNMPIKDMPKIRLEESNGYCLYLKEHLDNMCLSDADSIADDTDLLVISTKAMFSENWKVVVEK